MCKKNITPNSLFLDIIWRNINFSRLVLQLLLLTGIMFGWGTISKAQSPSSDWSPPIDITKSSSSTSAIYGTILCDQYQNTHLFWMDRPTDANPAMYYRHDINGEWSDPVDVITTSEPTMIRIAAAISNKNDTIHVLWVNKWIRGDVFYSQAPLINASDPKAWSSPRVLAYAGDSGYIAIDSEGKIHVVYGTSDSEAYQMGIDYISSEDDGITWSNPVTIFSDVTPVPSDPLARIAVDDAGRIHVGITLRSQEYGVNSEVGYVRSPDGGQTWDEYNLVSEQGQTFQGVAVMAPYAFGEDEIHLTWHDPRRMHQWSLDGGETWSEPIEIMSLGGAFGGPNALVKDSAGIVHVVTAVNGGVFSAAWDGERWGPKEQIDNRQIDPHGQHIGLCQGNIVQVVYDDRNDEQKVWFSSRQVDAPHLERQPIPTPIRAVVINNPAPTPTAVPVEERPKLPDDLQGEVASPILLSANPVMPIAVSVISVVMILIIIIFFMIFRSR